MGTHFPLVLSLRMSGAIPPLYSQASQDLNKVPVESGWPGLEPSSCSQYSEDFNHVPVESG